MLNKDNLFKSYPRYVLLIYVNWLMFTNIPFLGRFRMNFIYVAAILSIPFLFRKVNLKETIIMNAPICILMVLSLISSLFTKTFLNYYLWITILTLLAASEFIATVDEEEIRKLISSLYISLETIMILSLIGILLVKLTDLENSDIFTISYSLGNFIQDNRFFGVLNNCNLLGPLAGIATILSLNNIIESRNNYKNLILNILLTVMNLYLLVGSRSYTAMIAFIACTVVLILCNLNKHRKTIFITVVIIGVLIIALAILNIDNLERILHRDIRTASNRVLVWQTCFKILEDHPLVGYGDLSNYSVVAQERNLHMSEGGAHSMYVEIATRSGIPAMIIYISAILITLVRTIVLYLKGKDFKDNTLSESFLLFIFGILHGLGEGQQLFTNSPIMIIFISAFLILNYKIHEISQNN